MKINLSKGDSAFVIRKNGNREILVDKPKSEDQPISESTYIITALAISLHNAKLLEKICENFENENKKTKAKNN